MSEKHDTRINNLAHVQRSPFLFRDDALQVDWLELAGPISGTYELVKPHLRPGISRFIGLDRDSDRVHTNRDVFGEDELKRWVCGDLVREISKNPLEYQRVGVLNYDTESTVASNKFADKDLKELLAFAESAFWRLGAFMLILNYTTRHVTGAEIDRIITEAARDAGAGSIDLSKVDLSDKDLFYYQGDNIRRLNLRIHYGPIWRAA